MWPFLLYFIIPLTKVVFTKITNESGQQFPITLLVFEDILDFYKVYQFSQYVKGEEAMIVGKKVARELSLKLSSSAKIILGHQPVTLSVLTIFPRSSFFDEIVVTDSANVNNRLNELNIDFSSIIINLRV
ncbi:hypothetical protein SY88_02815 [Clostridiales bacterium PH28_bin88]|nr:hypothetical protein SY88_02815 [Clostridiales bacterium PH28_bin88]